MPYSYTQATMRVDVRRHAVVEGMVDRYTDVVVDELFFPHYKAFRHLVAAEGHPHFLTRYEYTPGTVTQVLTDSSIRNMLSLRAIGVEQTGGGSNPPTYRMDPIEDGRIFGFASSTGIPRFYQVESDGVTGNVSIYAYPTPDQIYKYHLRFYDGLASGSPPTTYIFHGGWEKLPVLQAAQDIARRERDTQLVAMLEAEIREIQSDVKRDARRLSRRRGPRVDVIQQNRFSREWGRYDR